MQIKSEDPWEESFENPPKKPKAIRIEESPNKEKKLVAYFYDKDGKKIKTTHFGARGMSDFTQHKDPTRMKRYLARHKGMGENWKDPTTAGALSRWILWGKPSLRESFNDFKKRFKLEGVMAVTNTKMNPPDTLEEDFDWMKENASDAYEREQEDPDFNGREWWNEQIPWIEERYGTEPLDVTWVTPLDTTNFDPSDKSQEFDDNGVKPLHFLNQLKRIPMTKQPTPERIMQIALNIGQGQASGSVTKDYSLSDFVTMSNPPNIPFPIPEEYQEELERRLSDEMTSDGYRPLRVQPDFIDSGGYDDQPSDWSYVQGEYQEFLDEIEAQDWDEAYAEYSDVEGHTAYFLWTNYRIDMPVYTHDHINKVLFRIRLFEELFDHYGFDFGPEYLKGGSNYEKVFKVRAALDAAAADQDKPKIRDSDEQLKNLINDIVEVRKNPMAPGYQSYGWTTQDWRSIKVNNKGKIDYSQKCGAEGTKTPSGSPRLCLPAAVVKSLIRTESGKEVIRIQARKKARAKKGERVPWHPRIKKIWKRIEDKTVKDKPNPPSFISARDPQKWSDRYDKIIKMSGDELMQLAEKQAAERGLTIELTVENREYKETLRQLKLPPKQQKMYKEYIESMERATITLSRGNKLLDRLRFTILTQSPKELVDYLTNRKVWRKESRGKRLEGLGRITRRRNTTHFDVYEIPMVAALQNKKRFPFAVAGSGGYQMSEGQKGKGYYGIIKTYQAGFLEANDMEQYGMGESPMRSDLYQSYGWLTAFSYKDNHPYPSKAAEYYLNVAGKSKLANKDADYWNVYRPVYSRKMTGAAYRAGVKKMLDAVTNPPEWRHGEFAEEDPFEEYF
jgi:hypothetical protein